VSGGAAGSLHDEARADPLPTVGGGGVDGLKSSSLAGDHDPAGGDDLVAARIHSYVPAASARAEDHAKVLEPTSEKLPEARFLGQVIARSDL
jgi:hypothetical protein